MTGKAKLQTAVALLVLGTIIYLIYLWVSNLSFGSAHSYGWLLYVVAGIILLLVLHKLGWLKKFSQKCADVWVWATKKRTATGTGVAATAATTTTSTTNVAQVKGQRSFLDKLILTIVLAALTALVIVNWDHLSGVVHEISKSSYWSSAKPWLVAIAIGTVILLAFWGLKKILSKEKFGEIVTFAIVGVLVLVLLGFAGELLNGLVRSGRSVSAPPSVTSPASSPATPVRKLPGSIVTNPMKWTPVPCSNWNDVQIEPRNGKSVKVRILDAQGVQVIEDFTITGGSEPDVYIPTQYLAGVWHFQSANEDELVDVDFLEGVPLRN